MSLKDLLGLFDGKKQSDGLNVSLEQGSKFNSIQSRIEASVIPQLSIIEQTPGLGSVIENFSGNSPEAPLGQVNSAEYKEMTALENDFNKAVSTYSQKQNALMGAAQQSSRGKGWSWSVIKDHIMWSGEKNPKENKITIPIIGTIIIGFGNVTPIANEIPKIKLACIAAIKEIADIFPSAIEEREIGDVSALFINP